MSLYNISINSIGVVYLQDQPNLISGIARTLDDDSQADELQKMALRLLQSLTWDINCRATLNNIVETVCLQDECVIFSIHKLKIRFVFRYRKDASKNLNGRRMLKSKQRLQLFFII